MNSRVAWERRTGPSRAGRASHRSRDQRKRWKPIRKYYFLRTFRWAVGVTPYQFLLGVRMRPAAMRLCTTPMPVAIIAYDAGFDDLSTFTNRFRDVFGMSPGRFRRVRTHGQSRACI
ncbi:MAG: helix-turn-helix transcriptional regulator [Dehalococcoidia bacterium]